MSDDKKDINNQVMEFMKNKGQGMVEHFQKMQQELEKKEVVGIGGVEDEDEYFVKVVLNGLQECKASKCKIGKGAFEGGQDVVVELMAAAINSAMEKLKGIMQNEVMEVYKKSDLSFEDKED